MVKIFILSLICAFYAPLEGGRVMLIAARESFAVHSRGTPTARDYVQDGLIAMWDGIENAGWGVHDPNATTWTDLVGGQWGSWNIQGAGSDHAIFNLASQLKTFNSYVNVPATIELSIFDVANMGGCFLNINNKTNWNGMATNGMLCPYFYNSSGITYQFYSKQTAVSWAGRDFCDNSTFSLQYSTTGIVAYANGVTKKTATVSNGESTKNYGIAGYAGVKFTGKARYLRLYSRALTAAEVAANHAIDKERFGL